MATKIDFSAPLWQCLSELCEGKNEVEHTFLFVSKYHLYILTLSKNIDDDVVYIFFRRIIMLRLLIATWLLSWHGVAAMAAPLKGCRVCTSSPCSSNGSPMLLDAMQKLVKKNDDDDDSVDIIEYNCLGGCGPGVVVKAFDRTSSSTNQRRRMLPAMTDETKTVQAAVQLLEEIDGLDTTALQELELKLEAGEHALNIDAPEVCARCGTVLQLYRGNCAKCGKYPY